MTGAAALSLDALLAPGGIRVLFHPIYDLSRGQGATVWAFEALVRGPEHTPLESAEALFGFVRERQAEPAIDRACVRAAFADAVMLPDPPAVTVNVHVATLGRDPEFVIFLAETARRSGFSPDQVVVEMVEQVPLWQEPTFQRSLDELRQRGFRIAIDDLGVGYANLGQILLTRPQVLKIDGSIVRGCHAEYYRWAMVEGTHLLATRLGAWSLAEGVEHQADLAAVRACGIRLVQGFVFGRPLPARELAALDLPRHAQLVLTDLPVEAA